jgi:hypothetical protein
LRVRDRLRSAKPDVTVPYVISVALEAQRRVAPDCRIAYPNGGTCLS